MAEADTLLVRHLPDQLNDDEKRDLLLHFGAQEVRVMSDRGKLRSCAFAKYPSEATAQFALGQLHQLSVLGSNLLVEFAQPHHNDHTSLPDPRATPLPTPIKPKDEAERIKNEMASFHREMTGLAPLFGVSYPLNPRFRYQYPSANNSIITNVGIAMLSNKRFYTQVLHLMNKMNLPAPFGPIPPVPPEVISNIGTQGFHVEEEEIESELETSSGEDQPTEVMPCLKRKTSSKIKRKVKRIRDLLSTAAKVPSTEKLKTSEVFDLPEVKKADFKINPIPNPVAPIIPDLKTGEEGGFGTFSPNVPTPKVPEEEKPKFITKEELKPNTLSKEDFMQLPVAKGYAPGKPTNKLYIKNLAKDVLEKDLTYIYGAFVNQDSTEEKNGFKVQLMSGKKMKGQAFVTFLGEQAARTALGETNGFILNGKALVVQFAKSHGSS